MKRILITGGAGFIGSHLCDYLIKDNYYIVIVDNLMLGDELNISHLFNSNNFKFYKVDILDYEKLSAIFKEESFETIFHLAANSDIADSTKDPNIDLNNTFLTTYNILNLMKEYEVRKIVFASSSAIYGEANQKITEAYGPLLPISNYGAAKLASEAFISSFIANYDMQAWILRFPNVVGERATHGVIYDFIKKLKKNPSELEVLGNGKQFKPYLYVKDLVEAMIFVWKNSNKKINMFNVGVDSRTRVKDIANLVVKAMKLNSKIIYGESDRGWTGDVPAFDYDLHNISQLGWKAHYTSDEAVKIAVENMVKDMKYI